MPDSLSSEGQYSSSISSTIYEEWSQPHILRSLVDAGMDVVTA